MPIKMIKVIMPDGGAAHLPGMVASQPSTRSRRPYQNKEGFWRWNGCIVIDQSKRPAASL